MSYKPGECGNPNGRPVGRQDKRTKLRQLLEPHASALIKKCVQLALEGDTHALRLCMERLIPRAKDEPIPFELPPGEITGDSVIAAGHNVLRALQEARLTPDEAKSALETIRLYKETIFIQEMSKKLNTIIEVYEKFPGMTHLKPVVQPLVEDEKNAPTKG